MKTAELLSLIDNTTRLTTPVAVWRMLDGQVVFGTEGKSLTQRELREAIEAGLVAA